MRTLTVCVALAASACAVGERVFDTSLQVTPGMPRADVIALMGTPASRSFNQNAEALTYCTTGNMVDQYVTIWLVDQRVETLTNYTDTSGFLCTMDLPEIDWGQAPPDVRIAIDSTLSVTKP